MPENPLQPQTPPLSEKPLGPANWVRDMVTDRPLGAPAVPPLAAKPLVPPVVPPVVDKSVVVPPVGKPVVAPVIEEKPADAIPAATTPAPAATPTPPPASK
jgi:hypothetical protein